MNNKSKRFVLGRAHVLSLALLAVGAIAGSAMLSQSAVAQGGGKVQMQDFHFTMKLAAHNPDFPFANEHAEIGLLVPAVQRLSEPAGEVRLKGDGWSMTIPVFGGAKPFHQNLKVWVDVVYGGGFEFHISDGSGEVRHARALGTNVSVGITERTSGLIYSGESGGMESAVVKHVGGMQVALGDGSVRSIRSDVYLPPMQQVDLTDLNVVRNNFGPISPDPIDPNLPMTANPRVEVGMLLPAVQKVREAAARMQLVGDGWVKEFPLYSGEVPTHVNRTIYVGTANGGVWKTSMFDPADGSVIEWEVPSPNFTVRLLPAVQSDRRTYNVRAATVKHHAIGALQNVDGSNTPILIGLLLPAVQKVR